MAANGVTRYAVVGSDMETSAHCVAFAAAHPGAVAVVGIHPHEAKGYKPEDLQTLADWYTSGQAVAIGEIGLDYFYDLSPRDVQKNVCAAQLNLAYELGAPVVFHIRDAHGDVLDLLRAHKGRLPGRHCALLFRQLGKCEGISEFGLLHFLCGSCDLQESAAFAAGGGEWCRRIGC